MSKSRTQWLSIFGAPEIGDSSLRFSSTERPKKTATKSDNTKAPATLPYVVLRSDLYFEAGDIAGQLFIQEPDSKIQFRLSSEDNRRVFVGINVKEYPYGISLLEGGETVGLDLSGRGSQPPTGQWTPFQIRVRGSQVEFYVQGVRCAAANARLVRAPLELSLAGYGQIEVRNLQIETIRPKVFVVMQFSDEYTALYRDVIEPVCYEYGYEVVRGDDVYTNGLIIEDIAQSIRASSLIIADITPNNANVYYEVGFAHGIGKPTILLSDRVRDKLPFDVSGFRLLFYDNTIGGKTAVESALRKHLDHLRGA